MSRHAGAAVALTLLMLLAAPVARAAPPVTSYLNVDSSGHCPRYGQLEVCSGEIPSFDGSKLDVDVTLPVDAHLRSSPAAARGGHPLIVLVHGAGGSDKPNKYEFESLTDEGNGADKYHWNTHWFATHGFYVITPTQRGYIDEGPAFPWQPHTPSGTSVDLPNGTIRLTSIEFSARDEQWLAAQVARSFDVDTSRIAVSGRTSGGGESWQLATERRWTFPHQVDPTLPILTLDAAIPRTTWTDLLYAFSPHGHGGGPDGRDIYESSFGRPGDELPLNGLYGATKLSFLAFIYALIANRQGVLEAGLSTTPSQEGRVDLHAWVARALAGDPESIGGFEDPPQAQLRRGMTRFRSAYFQPRAWAAQRPGHEVAIFAVQGWTDDLFTPVEAFREFYYLKRLDPGWPIQLALADVGNAPAQNPPAVWHDLNARAWDFVLRAMRLGGDGAPAPAVVSFPTRCPTQADAGSPVSAAAPDRLGPGTLTVAFKSGGRLTSATGALDPDSIANEPNLGARLMPCPKSTGADLAPYTARSRPLARAATYAGLGYVTVPYTLTGTRAQLDVRVWDASPGGSPTTFVTHGTYSFDVPARDAGAGTVRVPLFGNHWVLASGHAIRIDLSQADQPFLRPTNAPSTIAFGPPRLTLPTVEPANETVGEAP